VVFSVSEEQRDLQRAHGRLGASARITVTAPTAVMPYAARIAELARLDPERIAVVEARPDGSDLFLTRGDLDTRSNQVAQVLAQRGVRQGGRVAVALPSGIHHVITSTAAWKLGACVLPVNPSAPQPERDALLELFEPDVVVARTGRFDLGPDDLDATNEREVEALPLRVADPGKAIGTGGSTGRPKLIVEPGPWGLADNLGPWFEVIGLWPGETQLVCSPSYHNFGFDRVYGGLLAGTTSVVMSRFEAGLAVDLVERYSVAAVCLVPTMMAHIAKLPGVDDRDLSSVRLVFHTAGPCAPALKRRWIELVGAESVLEIFGSTEGFGYTLLDGVEWLAHPGSVGYPIASEVRIKDEAGAQVGAGVVGEIWMRREGVADRYVGAVARIDPEGFGSVGDLGWLDDDGYLYLADRRTDLILRGGANVYPAEVEGVLHEHPAVADVAVIGLPDEDLGQRVHGVVELLPGAHRPTQDELRTFCRERLAGYKVPAEFDFVDAMPRDESGKLRRRALIESRS
jgi:bile acid-coenzyme A ligase